MIVPVSVWVPVPVPSSVHLHCHSANQLIDLCSLFAVVPYLVASFHFVKVRKVNDLIVSFSGFLLFPSIENSSGCFFLFFSMSCLVLSCLVCLPVRLSPSVIFSFIYLSAADVKSFCLCTCPLQAPLVCSLERRSVFSHSPSSCSQKLLVYIFRGNAHIDCDKRETGIPI